MGSTFKVTAQGHRLTKRLRPTPRALEYFPSLISYPASVGFLESNKKLNSSDFTLKSFPRGTMAKNLLAVKET